MHIFSSSVAGRKTSGCLSKNGRVRITNFVLLNRGPFRLMVSIFYSHRYRATMASGMTGPSFLDVRTPIKLPDSLRGEKYAFVALPLAEFLPGGGVTEENIGVGRLCALDPNLPADAFVQGVVILTQRPQALASWLAGTEVAASEGIGLPNRGKSDLSSSLALVEIGDSCG